MVRLISDIKINLKQVETELKPEGKPTRKRIAALKALHDLAATALLLESTAYASARRLEKIRRAIRGERGPLASAIRQVTA